MITLADEDKSDSVEMIRQLVRMGHKLYATEGTAALIERHGMPVQMVTKRIGRGHPDMLDVILERTVDCVINTPGRPTKKFWMGSRSDARPSSGAYRVSPPSTPQGRSWTRWRSLTPSTRSNHFRSTVLPGPATDAECMTDYDGIQARRT